MPAAKDEWWRVAPRCRLGLLTAIDVMVQRQDGATLQLAEACVPICAA